MKVQIKFIDNHTEEKIIETDTNLIEIKLPKSNDCPTGAKVAITQEDVSVFTHNDKSLLGETYSDMMLKAFEDKVLDSEDYEIIIDQKNERINLLRDEIDTLKRQLGQKTLAQN